jgi:hypothetical protein
MKVKSNNTGTFTKQDSVSFDSSLWHATNGTINWSEFPTQEPYSEADVFHTQLTHTTEGVPSSDVNWVIRIGKGGQLYYADIEGVGQIICPQRVFSAWNDDCMTTTVHGKDVVDSSSELNVGPYNDNWTNGYVHGSGMYIKPHMDPISTKPFYNPILSERFDSNDRSYTIINWGLVPKPSINRGDVLFYSRYRDLGNGVLEITFYCYNFGSRVYTFAETPWWAVRPSKYANMIEGINGTSSFKINNKTFQSGAISSKGGWGAHTADPKNPNSNTCCLVWGKNTSAMSVNFGLVNNTDRDMALISPSKSSFNMPFGTGIRYRRFAIFGKLSDVSNKAAKLDQYATFEPIEFTEQLKEKIPLYERVFDSQNILSTQPNLENIKACSVSAVPIKGSYPLFLLKNKNTGIYFLTTDPYTACGKIPFVNPYPPTHAKYLKYQNRVIYRPYDGNTEWVAVLGYVLPINNSKISSGEMVTLSSVTSNIQFLAGEKLNSSELMVWPIN